MKRLVMLAFAGLVLSAVAEDYLSAEITSARQRYPWNGKVDIDFTVASTNPNKPVIVTFTAVDSTVSPATNLTAQSFDGVMTNVFAVMPGSYRTVWNTDDDVPQSVIDRVTFKVTASTDYPDVDNRRYLIVDLRKGTAASKTDKYPTTFLPAMPLGLAIGAQAVKTDYLVLRRIPATTSDEWKALSGGKDYYMMGCPEDEPYRGDCSVLTPRKVRLTKPFYIGIYEFTQRQYELVTGNRPSFYSNDVCYAARPLENVKANSDVGSKNSDPGIFMREIRDRTGLDFQLPTEAEWEHAARAGTTTAWNDGTEFVGDGWGDENLARLARYAYNGGNEHNDDRMADAKSSTAIVGSYAPNAWGIYDMHGNVSEMCRDRWWNGDAAVAQHWSGYDADTDVWTDPGGFNYDNNDYQATRGSYFSEKASLSRIAVRWSYIGYGNTAAKKNVGFRIVCHVEE